MPPAAKIDVEYNFTMHDPKRLKVGHDELQCTNTGATAASMQDKEGNVTLSFKQSSVARRQYEGSSMAGKKRAKASELKPNNVKDLHRPDMFKLQLDELLLAVRPDYAKLTGPIDSALQKLKTLLEAIEDREPVTVSEAAKTMHRTHKITIPFPDPKPDNDAPYKMTYSRPSKISVVGSYALKTMTKSDDVLEADMAVTLPSSILREKDYLNYHYFYKKAYYLACLAAGLQNSGSDEFEFFFDYLGENSLQPILVVKPVVHDSGRSLAKFHIRIIPTAPLGVFVETKLYPGRNAIRPQLMSIDAGKSAAPTPFYNATLRADSNMTQNLNLLHRAFKSAEGLRDACQLGRIWLHQRGLGTAVSAGGFGNFEWAILSALLLQGGGLRDHSILSKTYSSYQLFKSVIQYLSTIDLRANPVLFQAPGVLIPKTNCPVFFDGPRGQNLLFKMTPWSYATLVEEARITFEMLNDATFDHFEAIFIMKNDSLLQKYDSVFQLPVPFSTESHSSTDHVTPLSVFMSNIHALLKEGLSDRVRSIQIKTVKAAPWPLSCKSSVDCTWILVGVVFDPGNIERVVDHGPAAENQKSAAMYRHFWGEKAELRRFKDGKIIESLVWSLSTGRSIFREIITYLFKRHLGGEVSKEFKFVDLDFSQLLPISKSKPDSFSSLNTAFRTLEHDIRSLHTLPLQPKLVSAISSQIRFTSVQTPDFNTHNYLREPAEVILEFEAFGRWPENVNALQQTKIAFLLKMGSLLEASVERLSTRIRLENTDQPLLNCAALDVVYPSGAIFRLRIFIDKEQNLLERQIKENSNDPLTREAATFAKSLNAHMCIQLPLHSQSVVTQCTRHPLLSPTIRLVKKWFESHMLSAHFKEELVELLVLRTFLQPYPWRPPSSSNTGLLRTLLFLSRWNWRLDPLIIDFSGTINSRDVTASRTRLEAWRKIDPGMNRVALIVASNHDRTGTAFTLDEPSKVAAARMTALARSACLVAKDEMLDLNPKILFRSSTDDYDFVLHLSPNFKDSSRLQSHRDAAKFKNLEVQSEENLSLAGYRPEQLFLDELKRLYSTSILFFPNSNPRSVIGAVWNPQTASRPFKPNLAYGTKPVLSGRPADPGLDVEINKSAILAEIVRLGGDLIARLEVHGKGDGGQRQQFDQSNHSSGDKSTTAN